jgi:hypothetical protein
MSYYMSTLAASNRGLQRLKAVLLRTEIVSMAFVRTVWIYLSSIVATGSFR